MIKKQRSQLFDTLGFGLVRGFPILDYERKDQAIIFMGIGSYIGMYIYARYDYVLNANDDSSLYR